MTVAIKQMTTDLECIDIDAMINFYRDALGFRVVMSGEAEGGRWAVVGHGGAQVSFWETSDPDAYRKRQALGQYSVNLHFIVADLDRAFEYLKTNPNWKVATKIVTEPWGLRELAVEDPEGYQITLAEPASG